MSRALLMMMALSCALAVSAIYYQQPLLPQIASTWGMTSMGGSIIATSTQVGYATGLLLFVPLADGIQPRKLARTAIVGNAVALLGCAAAPTFLLMVTSSFLVGATAVTAQFVIPAVSGSAAPESRGRIVGILLGGLSSGVLLARTMSGFVGAHFGWRVMFVAASVVDVALLFVIGKLPLLPGLKAIHYRELMRSLVVLVREERLLRISAATGFLIFAAFSAVWATLAALLLRPPYGFGAATIGAFGLVGVVGLVLSPYIGSLIDRIGQRFAVSAGAILIVLAFSALATSATRLAWLVVSLILLYLGNRAGFVGNQARIYALRPEARSRLNTVYMTSYFLGGATGSVLGGYGANLYGWIGLAAIGAALSIAALAVNALAYTRPNATLADRPS
jgi:predicted MFS family arabinose efflux permease